MYRSRILLLFVMELLEVCPYYFIKDQHVDHVNVNKFSTFSSEIAFSNKLHLHNSNNCSYEFLVIIPSLLYSLTNNI